MPEIPMYHEGSRQLQDKFATRRLADRLVESLAFPSYDGNGMFKSLGNLLVNPYVGMLFIDFVTPKRLRVNGRATVHEADPLLTEFVGAQVIVRICPVPEWKRYPEFRDVLPPGDPAADTSGVP